MERLQERVALITGAASGIGRVTAERLADEGATVVVTDVQDEAGEQTAAELRDAGGESLYVHLDVTDEAGGGPLSSACSPSSAGSTSSSTTPGMGDLATIEETSLADWERTVAIDQTGVFLGMKTCAEALKASGHGSVINISSIFGTSRRLRHLTRLPRCKGGGAYPDQERRAALGHRRRARETGSTRASRYADPRSGEGDGRLGTR